MMIEMEEFLKILLSLSFSGTFLFLVVLLIVQTCRNRLSRRWQYYIWLLVVLRFLIPLTFTHTVTGYLFRGVERIVAERRTADVPESAERKNDISENAADKITDGLEKNTDGQGMGSGEEMDPAALTVTFHEKSGSRRIPAVPLLLSGIWAAGVLILLIRRIAAYRSYMRFLKKGNAEVSDLETLNLLAEAQERSKIKRTIGLYRNPMITSPIMTGFVRPLIVIPDKKMTDGELACIFAHELVHFKYYDMFYKWLVQMTICIHWFNPVVYLLGKEVNKRCELSCDEKVIGALNEQERKDYGDTLLSFLNRGKTYQNPFTSITLTEGAEQLIERLGAIMDYRKKSKTIVILTTVLTVLLCFLFSGIGAYAGARAGQQDTGHISLEQAEAELIRDVGVKIAAGDGVIPEARESVGQKVEELKKEYYCYFQQTFYKEPYMIEYGWNLGKEDAENYARTEILLNDQSRMAVYFSEEAGDWMKDEAAMDAVGRLTGELKTEARGKYGIELERPYVLRIVYLPSDEIEAFAKRAFENGELADFAAVVGMLPGKVKAEYCERSYTEDDIGFFSVIISEMSADHIKRFAQRCYEENEIDYFAIAADDLTEKDRKDLMEKALREGRDMYYYILENEEDRGY